MTHDGFIYGLLQDHRKVLYNFCNFYRVEDNEGFSFLIFMSISLALMKLCDL